MKIEAGKYYLIRDGRKVGPMMFEDHDEWPFELDHIKNELPDDLACTLWSFDGKSVDDRVLDIVAEAKDWKPMTVGELIAKIETIRILKTKIEVNMHYRNQKFYSGKDSTTDDERIDGYRNELVRLEGEEIQINGEES